jgi:hypothetical protein
MENVTYVEILNPITQKVMDYVVIDLGNDEFSSMPKSEYDKLQAEQFTPIVTDAD